ncbi:MAG: aspartate aminotransferase family protein [Ardenticatenaceae bacterium]|nr:aspartate aminotransferase family protein [Ardenticatenaceae bacterium]
MNQSNLMNQILEQENRTTSGVYGKREVALVRGRGVRVWDADGREYIDCSAGYGVANSGHCHPHVVAAIQAQAETLLASPEFVYNDKRAALQEKLVSILPEGLERVYLCNSGAEANEAALKFARLSTGRTEVVACFKGFHGRTMGALSATHKSQYKKPFEPLVPGFKHVPFNNLEKMAAAITEQTAAVILEAVQGEGGVNPADPDFLRGVRRLCDERGALLIIDEVQTGFGRTGRWFACQHSDVVPDLLTMGKGLGGGVPMGAVGIGVRVQKLAPGTHGSTFGGNPLICAAALANIEAFEQDQLVERSAEIGRYFQERLRALNLPVIRDVRGLGLMIGIELKTRVIPILKEVQAHGVIAMPAGATVLRLLPPLVITRAEVDEVVEVIHEAIKKITDIRPQTTVGGSL